MVGVSSPCWAIDGRFGMKSTKRNGRPGTRVCAVISACMLIVSTLPACTGSALPSARSTVRDEPSQVRQQSQATSTPEPLVFEDETSKSLPVAQNEEIVEECSNALYVDEPLASGYMRVSEGLWQICDEQLASCGKACRRKKSEAAKAFCFMACNKAYSRCLKLAGLTKTFDALDKRGNG